MARIVETGGFGFSFENGDPRSLMNAIIMLINHPSVSCRMGHLGRAVVFNSYSWEKIVQQFEKAYEDVKKEMKLFK